MDAESFFARWSKRKTQVEQEESGNGAADKEQVPVEHQEGVASKSETHDKPLTLEDVGALTSDSDFRPFVSRGVDESIRRSAMKKLFSDPHFNVMDGLDVYIDDYSKSVPIPAQVLAMMNHPEYLLNPLALFEKPEEEKQPDEATQIAQNAPDIEPASDPEEIPPANAAGNAVNPPDRPANDDPV